MQRQLPARQISKVRRHRSLPAALQIAIIIRTKDRPHLLTRSLQSLAEQKRQPDEIIVVNDGGIAIDDVPHEFSGLHINLINNTTSQGRSRAGNQGVQATQSDVIGFLDDDDRYLPDHLQRLEKAMLHFDAKVAYSGCRLLQRDMLGDTVILQEKTLGQFNDPFDAERLCYENYIPLINLLINKNLWLEVGGFDDSFEVFEDWDVLLRLSKYTPFYHINHITTEYAIWGGPQITQRMSQQRWREAYRQFLDKHLMPLSQSEQLQYLAEFWRVSQERRGILQQNTQEQQVQQAQFFQNQHDIEQARHQLTHYQEQNQQLQQQQAQLQADWSQKYEQLQSESSKQINQTQSDWIGKYEQLQSDYAELQADWTAKYQQLQSDYTRQQADWITKYQQLQSDNAKDYAHLQSDWTAKYQQLQSEHTQQLAQSKAELIKKYELLQLDKIKQYEELQSAYTQQEIHFKQQQAKMLQALAKQEQRYTELQCLAQQDVEHCQSLQNSLHEVTKQLAIGMNQSALETLFSSQPATVTLSEAGLEDYQRLIAWIRDKASQLKELEQHFAAQTQPLRTDYQELHKQLADLIQLISASHWPQLRRYANLVQDINGKLEHIFSQTEHYISLSTNISDKLGLNAIKKHAPQGVDELPPPRPLSPVYPTLISSAGTPENSQVMESVLEKGSVPFMLERGVALVFSIYCSLDNFFRLNILLGTCLRINTCQLRVIVRDLNTKTPLRVVYLEGLEILDNRFQPITFDPLTDSAGKTYQIEIDSPDADGTSCLAVWCHPKQPSVHTVPSLPESITQHSPHTLPQWVRQSLLDIPLSSSLQAESAPHIFVIWGLTEATPILHLHLLLGRLNQALKQADSAGQVIVCGQFSPELKQYSQQHQLNLLATSSPHIDLPLLLEWGKAQTTTAKYLWCCELQALPSIDIVERALEMFLDVPKAGLLVPLEKQSDGRIRAGYASLMRDGVLQTSLAGAPADHPYYGYRRTIEAASSQLIIVKIAALSHLNLGEVSVYYTPMYQLTELIWQLKNQDYLALYEAALCYEQDQPYPQFTEQDYNEDCDHFYQRWAEQLPQHMTPLNRQLNTLLNPQLQPTLLVIDATLPMYDEDSGSLRLYTWLKIWISLGYRVTFFPDNLDSQFKYRHALEALGIEVFHGNFRIADAMAYRTFDFALICRVEIGHRYIPFVRLLSPKTVILYDTVDIHYIREQRQAEIEKNSQLAAHAQMTKRKELSNCLLADRVITVTEEDAFHLQTELPNLNYSVIPNIHQHQPPPDISFEQRDGLVFIGNYNHQPNQDAVYYFVEVVLPKIHTRLPDVCLYLIGSNMPDKMKALANQNVKIIGWVEQVEPAFAQRRVFVSYLRYGAGMKGKLGHALSVGLPVVTTTIGAEGMGLLEEETALIADEPDQFADAVCRLYTDSTLWETLSHQGKEYIEQYYGEAAVHDKLRDLLSYYTSH